MKPNLVAFKIDRRAIAQTVFSELRPIFWDARSLSNIAADAEAAVTGLVRWTLEKFDPESVALEIATKDGTRVAFLTSLAVRLFREAGVPVFQLSKEVLFETYAEPRLSSRAMLRDTVLQIFSQLQTRRRLLGPMLDAAALGFYVQASSLLSLTN